MSWTLATQIKQEAEEFLNQEGQRGKMPQGPGVDDNTKSSGASANKKGPLHGGITSNTCSTPRSMQSTTTSSPGKRIRHVTFQTLSPLAPGNDGDDSSSDESSTSSQSTSASDEGSTSGTSASGTRKIKSNRRKHKSRSMSSKGSVVSDTLKSTLSQLSIDYAKSKSKPMIKISMADILGFDGTVKSWKSHYTSMLTTYALGRKAHLLTVRSKQDKKEHLM